MRLRFTPRAIENVAAIADHLYQRDPATAGRVRAALDDGLRNLLLFPGIGRRQQVDGVRKLVVRYDYLVYYIVDEVEQEISILAVRHSAQARAHDDR